LRIAVPDRIIPHGAPALLHAKYGLDVDGIFEKIKNFAHEFPVRPELRYRSLLRT
jgi:deoxyxylulose-5-phosphate synthase